MMITAGPYLMSDEEIARGALFGQAAIPPTAPDGPHPPPRTVVEGLVRRALLRPPCVIAFSGGRDSSAVLALATTIARREGLAEPIPVTRRFPGIPTTDETDWQELVIRHLELDEWQKVEFGAQFDLVGPLAAPMLLAHGVIWTPLFYSYQAVLPFARGGSLLDGEGGDQLFDHSYRAYAIADLLRGRVRPSRRSLRRVAVTLAPRPLLRSKYRRRVTSFMPWLRSEAAEQAAEELWATETAEPRTYPRAARWRLTSRSSVAGRQTIRYMADAQDVLHLSPLWDPAFVDAVVTSRGMAGFASRTEAMRRYFGDLLPPPILERETKSSFGAAAFGATSKAFVDQWDGTGVPDKLVDSGVLRREWARESPNGLSFALLQAAWLSAQRQRPA